VGPSVGFIGPTTGETNGVAARLWPYRPWLADDTRPCRSAEEERGDRTGKKSNACHTDRVFPGGIDWIEMM